MDSRCVKNKSCAFFEDLDQVLEKQARRIIGSTSHGEVESFHSEGAQLGSTAQFWSQVDEANGKDWVSQSLHGRLQSNFHHVFLQDSIQKSRKDCKEDSWQKLRWTEM